MSAFFFALYNPDFIHVHLCTPSPHTDHILCESLRVTACSSCGFLLLNGNTKPVLLPPFSVQKHLQQVCCDSCIRPKIFQSLWSLGKISIANLLWDYQFLRLLFWIEGMHRLLCLLLALNYSNELMLHTFHCSEMLCLKVTTKRQDHHSKFNEDYLLIWDKKVQGIW
jgi:hypothetical protein